MERFICIHGHFYQPPRENPWLESVEIQDSANPYHDWNERINAECYAPNTAYRSLDSEGRIRGVISNYARISFNFGPTLLSWLEKNAPETYQEILAADRQSMAWRSGHGAALAQVYNHVIMPLATLADKRTQIQWGIRDFKHRFRRFPEGLWLAETAVDTETLEVLAEAGIRFTILAPDQAGRFRMIGAGRWEKGVDSSRVYLCRLPSGRTINLFFYNGPISRAVAFEKILSSGEQFASRLITGFTENSDHPQLVHIATDGESYGHHHPFGEKGLGDALNRIGKSGLARLTNYGEYLELHPPTHEVEIVENSSWSCMHGIERWRSDCGCNSGGNGNWNQQWRQPLRSALDWLNGQLAACYEEGAKGYLKDPWQARNDYIEVMVDRSEENVNSFLLEHSLHPLDEKESIAVLSLLEMQRHAMLMFTSCGWFFDDLSGLEPVQIIQYAGRAIQLAEKYCYPDIEAPFLERLALARSNIPEMGNGAEIYARCVKPVMLDLIGVAAHYAVSFIFEEYGEETAVYCYRAFREDFLILHSGQMRLALGSIVIRSSITRISERFSFCNLYFGGHVLKCTVHPFVDEETYLAMKLEVETSFNEEDFAAIIRLMNSSFCRQSFSLKDLFRDEQRHVLKIIISGTLEEFEDEFVTLFENSRSLMKFLRETGMPVPHRFMTTAETALNLKLQKMFLPVMVDTLRIREIFSEIGSWNLNLDRVALEFIIRRRLEGAMAGLLKEPEDNCRLNEILLLVEAAKSLPVHINLWQTQNLYLVLVHSRASKLRYSSGGARDRNAWIDGVSNLGQLLFFNVPALLSAGKSQEV